MTDAAAAAAAAAPVAPVATAPPHYKDIGDYSVVANTASKTTKKRRRRSVVESESGDESGGGRDGGGPPAKRQKLEPSSASSSERTDADAFERLRAENGIEVKDEDGKQQRNNGGVGALDIDDVWAEFGRALVSNGQQKAYVNSKDDIDVVFVIDPTARSELIDVALKILPSEFTVTIFSQTDESGRTTSGVYLPRQTQQRAVFVLFQYALKTFIRPQEDGATFENLHFSKSDLEVVFQAEQTAVMYFIYSRSPTAEGRVFYAETNTNCFATGTIPQIVDPLYDDNGEYAQMLMEQAQQTQECVANCPAAFQFDAKVFNTTLNNAEKAGFDFCRLDGYVDEDLALGEGREDERLKLLRLFFEHIPAGATREAFPLLASLDEEGFKDLVANQDWSGWHSYTTKVQHSLFFGHVRHLKGNLEVFVDTEGKVHVRRIISAESFIQMSFAPSVC